MNFRSLDIIWKARHYYLLMSRRKQQVIYLEGYDSDENRIDEQVQLPQISSYRPSIANRKKKTSQKSSLIPFIILAFIVVFVIYFFSDKFRSPQSLSSKELFQIKQISKKKNQLLATEKQLEKQLTKLKQQLKDLKSTSISKPSSSSTSISKQSSSPPPASSSGLTLNVPKKFWVYLSRDVSSQNYISQLAFQNIKHYVQASDFELKIVNRENYRSFLTAQKAQSLENYLVTVQNSGKIANDIQHIKKQITMLFLLRQFGGVYMYSKFILVQNLDWLKTIRDSVHANKGNKNIAPQYFAFHNMDAGPRWAKQNREVDHQMGKLMYKFPGLTDNFLAGIANGAFINDVFLNFIKLTTSDVQAREQILRTVEKGFLKSTDTYHLYALSVHLTIQSKQAELDKEPKEKYTKFAIDFYGLVTMNQNYAAQKLAILFKNRLRTRNYFDNFYNYLAKFPQSQFQEMSGPIRYILNIDPYQQFNKRLQAFKNTQGSQVWTNSLLHKQLFLGNQEATIKQNRQKSTVASTFKKWESLPKKVWLYWDSGFENASAANQLCLENIKVNAKQAGFEVILVTDKNLIDYLPQQQITRIENTLKNAKFTVHKQLKSDFVRLALISKNGGMYMDLSYFWFESFKWIIQVAKQPSHIFFNRYGQHPKVLMQFHTLQGAPADWTIDQAANTKSAWHLALESNFIVADKDSEFVTEWYNMFIDFTINDFGKTEEKMRQCNVNDFRWTNPGDRYLTVMDSLKAVLGCRQKSIQNQLGKYQGIKNAADYYKLWSFNGFNGLQKFRYYNDYTFSFNGQINNDPQGLYRVSTNFNDETIGKVYKGVKLYSWNIHFLNIFLNNHKNNNFQTQSHPNSYFRKYLYDKDKLQFYSTDKLHVKAKQ